MGQSPDRESQDWIGGLGAAGAARSAAEERLRDALQLIASLELARRAAAAAWRPGRPGLAEQAAAAAATAIARDLPRYRAEVRFTTFAGKHAMFALSQAVASEYWRTRTWPAEPAGWDRLPERIGAQAAAGEWDGMLAALRLAVDEVLTVHQRAVFTAVLLSDLPAEALAAGLGPNRNAIYQALFEARRRLAVRLAADGPGLQGRPVPPAGGRWLGAMLAAEAGDAGCDLAFGALDSYAEAELAEQRPAGRFPGVAAHLASCGACRQDYEGLLAAVGSGQPAGGGQGSRPAAR